MAGPVAQRRSRQPHVRWNRSRRAPIQYIASRISRLANAQRPRARPAVQRSPAGLRVLLRKKIGQSGVFIAVTTPHTQIWPGIQVHSDNRRCAASRIAGTAIEGEPPGTGDRQGSRSPVGFPAFLKRVNATELRASTLHRPARHNETSIYRRPPPRAPPPPPDILCCICCICCVCP